MTEALDATCPPAPEAPERDQQNSDCQACAAAEKNPLTGIYQLGCMQCEARALAQSPMAHKAQGGDLGPLQEAMRKLWPTPEKYRAGRVAVWDWIQKQEKR